MFRDCLLSVCDAARTASVYARWQAYVWRGAGFNDAVYLLTQVNAGLNFEAQRVLGQPGHCGGKGYALRCAGSDTPAESNSCFYPPAPFSRSLLYVSTVLPSERESHSACENPTSDTTQKLAQLQVCV